MKYLALATDYDGTLASEGRVDRQTIAALERAKQAGLRLVLVTGRELGDLVATFPEVPLFDRVVAENGAVLVNPSTGAVRVLAEPAPTELIKALRQNDVPISVGRSIVATVEPYEHTLLSAIRDLGLEWHVIFNKGSVMALPAGITKASGLAPALDELGVSAAATIGMGDAENDHAFMHLCGVAVAVANALPALKKEAHFVTDAANGAGVRDVIDRILAGKLNLLDRVAPPMAGRLINPSR
jgi:hydroxymethylpyrimidine pyrophosphatase-like HAD family hydrolase